MNPDRLRDLGRTALRIEAQAIEHLIERVDAAFVAACECLLACRGRIVVLGIGKSGHIGGKLAATFASTGSPAFFVHPAEASHGDLGMITAQDVVLALSNSGTTDELLMLLPLIKRLGVPLVALTGNPESPLARAADVHLDVSVAQEACPLNLAPTASTTAALAMGDALAVSLLEARGFTADDFARSHPGGRLGRRLLLLIDELMHTGERLPRSRPDDPLPVALLEMTRKGLGMTIATDDDDRMLGVFTDGDLRRALEKGVDVRVARVSEVMTRNPRSIGPGALAVEAAEVMERMRISQLLVIGDDGQLEGALTTHDLMLAKVI